MSKNHVSIGLTKPKSPTNVGSIMRAAGCYGASSVFYTGERYDRAVKFQTDTKVVQDKIQLQAVESLLDHTPVINGESAKIICVELVEGATPLPDFEHPDNAFYIFGPEDNTISQDVINRADAVVYIPTVGCMNLAATVNVVLYDRLAKSPHTQGDDLIRSSRDKNNNVKLRNS